MRGFPRFLVLLWIAAAALAAALAHAFIDVIADYLVAHAAYDDVGAHGSREIVVAIAVAAAGFIALRGFRLCCDVAARRGVSAPDPPSWRLALGFVAATVVLACVAVPAMEWIDTLLAGRSLDGLGDAFGGSLTLGLGATAVVAAAVALATFAVARWLLSHRDRIIEAIVAIVFNAGRAPLAAARLGAFAAAPLRCKSVSAQRKGKRAPPRFVVLPTIKRRHNEDNHASPNSCGVLPDHRQRSHAIRGAHRPSLSCVLRGTHASTNGQRRQGGVLR